MPPLLGLSAAPRLVKGGAEAAAAAGGGLHVFDSEALQWAEAEHPNRAEPAVAAQPELHLGVGRR